MSETHVQPNRWAILVMAQLAIFMSTFEMSVVSLALPVIQTEFGVPLTQVKWIAVIYSGTAAMALPIAAYLGRRLGVVPVYRFGQVFFAIATISCGFATDIETLVVLRFVSGIGASFMLALNNVILLASFPSRQHGLALGISGSTFSLGVVSGLAAGGLLIQWLGWQSVFFVNLIPAIPMLAIGLFALGQGLGIRRERLSFDWMGLGLAAVALGSIMHALGPLLDASKSPDAMELILIAGSILLVGLWLRHEFSEGDSFLNLHLLRTAPLSFNFGNAILVRTGMGAVNFIIPFYLQSSLLLSPFKASLVLSAGAIAMGIFGPFAGRFLDRYGPLQTMRISLMLIALGILAYVMLPSSANDDGSVQLILIWVVCAQFLIGAGSVFFSGAVTYSSIRAVEKERWGVISGLQSVNLMVGTALGASIAADLVGSWSQGASGSTVIPPGALFTLFGIMAIITIGLCVLTWMKDRTAYDASLALDRHAGDSLATTAVLQE
jgi:MFS family permease